MPIPAVEGRVTFMYTYLQGKPITIKLVEGSFNVRVEVFEDHERKGKLRGITLGLELLSKDERVGRSSLRQKAIAFFQQINEFEEPNYILLTSPERT